MRAVILFFASLFALTTQAQTKIEFPTPFVNPPIEQSNKSLINQPGRCEFEVQNLSHKSAFVDIVYDNFSISAGHRVDPGYNLHIHLMDTSGVCHAAAYTLVYSPEAIILFKDFGFVDKTLRIYSALNDSMAVKQVEKQ